MSDIKRSYRILGVNVGEDISQIKAAYKKLASKYHPDKNIGNLESSRRFIEAKCAYEEIITERNQDA